MNLDQIQPNLLGLLAEIPALAPVVEHILIEDGVGNQDIPSEESLMTEGLSIRIMTPNAAGLVDAARGVVAMEYVTTVWVRTNPKIKEDDVAKWNPLTLEAAIIPKVLSYGMAPTNFFQITEDSEPETDFTDVGNNSRLIRFSTNVIMQ